VDDADEMDNNKKDNRATSRNGIFKGSDRSVRTAGTGEGLLRIARAEKYTRFAISRSQ
jgi:hypothetical protein